MKKLLSAALGVVMLLSIMTGAASAVFTDVPGTHAYKAAIDYCAAKNYVKGHGNETFDPEGSLIRAQFATVWCRFLDIIEENHSFSDITKLNKYYDTSVIVLRSLGILQGTDVSSYSPDAPVTREQLATIAMRTLGLGVANAEDYKVYTDHASVSDWAREGISACVNAGIFGELYDGAEFKPQQTVTRAELCKLIFNIDVPKHDITIAPLTGGAITASPTSARAGETVTLTITPDTGMQLKAGTLKYDTTDITGSSFIMPGEDVTITAQFEKSPLASIAVTTLPTKTVYTLGEAFERAGLVVTATYGDGSTKVVSGATVSPTNGTALNTLGQVTVTVSYYEDGVTKTTTFTVTVNEPQTEPPA